MTSLGVDASIRRGPGAVRPHGVSTHGVNEASWECQTLRTRPLSTEKWMKLGSWKNIFICIYIYIFMHYHYLYRDKAGKRNRIVSQALLNTSDREVGKRNTCSHTDHAQKGKFSTSHVMRAYWTCIYWTPHILRMPGKKSGKTYI